MVPLWEMILVGFLIVCAALIGALIITFWPYVLLGFTVMAIFVILAVRAY